MADINVNVHHYFHFPGEEAILERLGAISTSIEALKETITMNQQEAIDALTAVRAQQEKTANEIVALKGGVDTLNQTILDLEAQLANAGNVSPELEAAVNAVKAQAQVVDDLIPDAPVVA